MASCELVEADVVVILELDFLLTRVATAAGVQPLLLHDEVRIFHPRQASPGDALAFFVMVASVVAVGLVALAVEALVVSPLFLLE